jgi:hypothetical protein
MYALFYFDLQHNNWITTNYILYNILLSSTVSVNLLASNVVDRGLKTKLGQIKDY